MRFVILILFALTAGVSVVLAHSGATGVVKERMDAMTEMKDSLAVIGAMMKGEARFDASRVFEAASAIADHAGKIPEQFPDTRESRQKTSEATETVWRDFERFVELSQQLEEGARALAVADDEETVRRRLGVVGKTCSACHEDFRLKKH